MPLYDTEGYIESKAGPSAVALGGKKRILDAMQPTFLTPLMPISEELSAYIGSEGW